jgi:hypothetical protein
VNATIDSALEPSQRALVSAILSARPTAEDVALLSEALIGPWTLGLSAYRGNGHATAERALSAAFPVLRELLGHESFAGFACAFWHYAPPRRGDLARWGENLAIFIEQDRQLAPTPYLADVARVEWLLHRAATVGDAQALPGSFALLAEHALEHLQVRLAPGTAIVVSRWPVVTLIHAHQQVPPDLRHAAERLQSGTAETALVWRQGWQPRLCELIATDARRLTVALDGAPLQAVIDAADGGTEAALNWLSKGVREGWVLGLEPMRPATAPSRPNHP